MSKLYTWGAAATGRLGNGTTTPDVLVPTQIGTDTDWDKIATGSAHTIALKNGKLYAWGTATDGRLGNNTTSPNVTSPVQIGTDTDWTDVAAALQTSYAIRGGKLYSWGDDAGERLGNGTPFADVLVPTQIGSDTNWEKIAAGHVHCIAIKGGQLYGWGTNNNGQIGDNSTTERNAPVLVDSNTDWTQITAWSNHSAAIRGGKLYTWGSRSNGRLGDGNTTGNTLVPTQVGSDTNWSKISAGNGYCLALKTTGTLWSWGNPANGRLGNGTTTGNVTAPTQVGSATDWTQISAGDNYGLAIASSKLYSWGAAANGQLGNNSTTPDVTSPTQVGSDTTWDGVFAYQSSAAATQLANVAPANTAVPTVSGTAKVGQTLTTTDGTWTGTPTPTYGYQWQVSDNGTSGWSNISGATSSTFTITTSQSGKYIRSQVTATNVVDSATASSAATIQIVENPTVSTPTISGTAKVGQTLTGSASATAGYPAPTISYQWQVSDNGTSGWSNISGATSSTFTITTSQSGKYIRTQATATNSEGSDTKSSTATNQIVENPTVSTPTISGTAKVGQTLTGSASATAGYPAPTISYQWQENDGSGWSNISGANNLTYNLTNNQAGKIIRVEATATNSENSDSKTSTATSNVLQNATVSTPTISGTAKVGQTLTGSASATAGYPAPTISYQWQYSNDNGSSWSNISGATSSTFLLTDNQAGQTIRIEATATNSENSDTKTSTATSNVLQNVSNLTAPESFGYPLVGEIFTTNNGTWKGHPHPTYSYKWQSSSDGSTWNDISGATSSTYTITNNDAGKFIRSEITATNSENSISIFSNNNGPINQLPEINQVIINGLPSKVGETLTASASATAGYPSPMILYEWYQNDGDNWVFVNDGNSYIPTSSDAGLIIKVIAIAMNSEGTDSSEELTEETLWSPENTSIPTISCSGNLEIGETLTADPGIWTGYPDPIEIGLSYQWQISEDGENNWENVLNETTSELYLDESFGQKYVRIQVTADTVAGQLTVYSIATGYISEDPENIISPILSGTSNYQEIITVDPGEWGGFPEAEFTYSWELSENGSTSWETIDDEELETITLNENTVSFYIRAYVTATNPVGSASAHSNVFGPILRSPYLITNPTITGNPRLLQTITTNNGLFGGYEEPTYSYNWELSNDEITWIEIPTANQSTYTIANDNDLLGQYIRSKVTATNSLNYEISYSNSLGPIEEAAILPSFTELPTLNIQYGVPSVNLLIELNFEADGIPVPSETIQWQRRNIFESIWEWQNISGATSSTYTPVENDIGYQLRAKVTLTNTEGSIVENSSETFSVVPEFREPTVLEEPAIPNKIYLNEGFEIITYGQYDGYPAPIPDSSESIYQYTLNGYLIPYQEPTWKIVPQTGSPVPDYVVTISDELSNAQIRIKIVIKSYFNDQQLFDDLIVYSNVSENVRNKPYQKESFLPMSNAKLLDVFVGAVITGIDHDSEFLPEPYEGYRNKVYFGDYFNGINLSNSFYPDAFIKTKKTKVVNSTSGSGEGTIDYYNETIIIIPKVAEINQNDKLIIYHNKIISEWKVVSVDEYQYDPGMPSMLKCYVQFIG